jgi:acetyl-CoA acetyltransferase
MSFKGKCAIAGLGMTRMGQVYDFDAMGFGIEAVRLALDDAGLKASELDGLLVQPGVAWRESAGGLSWMANTEMQDMMGLRDLRLIATMNLGGATAGAMVAYAAQSIAAGMANAVACVFADNPLKPPQPGAHGSAGAAYGQALGMNASFGMFGAVATYGMVAKRHMELYGTTPEQFGAVAVAQRKWANMNPIAFFRERPLTLEDYLNSRWICEPFRLLDCCLVSNGGICVIVTSAERARDLRKPPVYILGAGQGHPGGDPVDRLASGAPLAKEVAFKMAGIELKDIDLVQLYDCYTFTVIVTLEDYGFCPKGEGGPFVADGHIGPGGSLPVNTGGGELSAYYLWGMTPLSEAVMQMRGEAGERQVKKHNICLVSGNGGHLTTHSTLVLGARPGRAVRKKPAPKAVEAAAQEVGN